MRLMTSEPVPLPHRMGNKSAMIATTVIIFRYSSKKMLSSVTGITTFIFSMARSMYSN